MIARQVVHPPRETLVAFGSGKLDPTAAVAVEEHISECEECCETLHGLGSDTFVDLLRESDDMQLDPIDGDSTTSPSSHTENISDLPPELSHHPRYRVLELLGKGGMGNVYKAEHTLMNRSVALKVINPDLMQNDQAVERFRREVQSAAQLAHPNIVAAYDAEQVGDVHLFVMEHVRGDNLSDVVKRGGPLDISRSCDYIRQAAYGLQHAHDMGLVHRDIKPHNLVVSVEGRVKILDFGLATLAAQVQPNEESNRDEYGNSPNLTTVGSMMGTPDFISPEQATNARSADIRSDIYSLGCTFYYLLTGHAPFTEGSALERVKAHAEIEPEPIENLRSDIPAELAGILRRMMSKDPAERFQDPANVANALESFVATPLTSEKPNGTFSSHATSARRAWWPPRLLPTTASSAFAIILAGIIYIATDDGTLVVESDDEGVEIVVRKGKSLRIVDTLTGTTSRRLSSGEYKVELKGNANEFDIDDDRFVMRRGKEVIVKVTRKRQEAGPSIRQVLADKQGTGWPATGGVSPDGRYVSMLSWDHGNLGLRELATGKEQYLTNGSGDIADGYAYYSKPSPDGKRIAYTWSLGTEDDSQLRVYDLDTGEDKLLYHNPDGASIYPSSWSSDGQTIVALLWTDAAQIVLVSVEECTVRSVRTLFWKWPETADISPDGRHIVYDAPVTAKSVDRDVFLLPINGEGDEVQIPHQAIDSHPLWTRDGRGIVFISNRSGDGALWYQEVSDGKPVGDARLLVEDINAGIHDGRPLGVTSDGAYYFARSSDPRHSGDIYTVTLDANAEHIVEGPKRLVQSHEGANTLPCWSADGKSLVYTSYRREAGQVVLVERDTATGKERSILQTSILQSHALTQGFRWWVWPQDYSPAWSPDGKSVMVANSTGLQSVDIASGTVAPLVADEDIPRFVWSRDGKAVYYVRIITTDQPSYKATSAEVVMRELESSREMILCEQPAIYDGYGTYSSINSIALSPDGSKLAFSTKSTINVIDVSGGTLGEILKLAENEDVAKEAGIVWASAGNSILFAKNDLSPQSDNASTKSELWKVSVEDKVSASLGLPAENVRQLCLHPDGKQLTYCRTPETPADGVWVVENFLPPAIADTSSQR